MRFFKLQLSDLSSRFYAVLLGTCALVVILSVLGGGGWLSIVVAICGVIYAFFAGEGKLICFFFGLVYSVLYLYIAYENKLYGDVMLNLLYLPINLIGIFGWRKNQNQEKTKIIILSLSIQGMVICACGVGIGTLLYGAYLQSIQAHFSYLNAFGVIAQVVAFYLQVRRYVQNYLLVTLANLVSILIWWLIWDVSKEQIAQLLSMVIFFCVGVYYYFEWRRGLR